jgi:hypothetical protein
MLPASRSLLLLFVLLPGVALAQGTSVPVSFLNELSTPVSVEIDQTPTCDLGAHTSPTVLPECVVRLASGDHTVTITSSDGRKLTEQISLSSTNSRCYRRIMEQDGTLKTVAACDIGGARAQQ